MTLKLFDSNTETVRNKLPPIKCKCGAIMLEGTVMSCFPGLICECGAWSTDNRRERRKKHTSTNKQNSLSIFLKHKKKKYYAA